MSASRSEQESALMIREDDTTPIILVVEDVAETRDGIERLKAMIIA